MRLFKNILLAASITLLLASCEDEMQVEEPSFELLNYELEAVEQAGGEVIYQVTFNMDEDAEIIAFYSGEYGSEYGYKDGRIANRLSCDFSFSTRTGYGERDPKAQFSVLVADDFNGSFDSTSIHDASWVDITDRFFIPELNVGDNNYYPSGEADLMDMLSSDKSVNLAFRYHTTNQFEDGIYAAVRIRDWIMTSETDLFGEAEVDLSWSMAEIGNLRAGRNSYTSSTITLRGNHGSFSNVEDSVYLAAETEAWVISEDVSNIIDLGPDVPTAVKAIGDPSMSSFIYEYTTPGEYTVTFLASNVNISDEKKIYKTYTISIPE